MTDLIWDARLAALCAWEFWVLATWRALPGPAWVRVILLVVCLAIPGPQDELLLIAVTAACRAYRARRASKGATR